MNKHSFLSVIFFITGICLFILGFLEGEVSGGFFVIFPFIMGSGVYGSAGVLCFFIAFLFYIFSFSSKLETDYSTIDYEPKKTSSKWGGVVFIGPIPIVFGSSWKTALLVMIIGFVFMLILYFLFFYSGFF